MASLALVAAVLALLTGVSSYFLGKHVERKAVESDWFCKASSPYFQCYLLTRRLDSSSWARGSYVSLSSPVWDETGQPLAKVLGYGVSA